MLEELIYKFLILLLYARLNSHPENKMNPGLSKWYFDRYWIVSVSHVLPLLLRAMLHFVHLNKL
jgi:hypothetical protein